MWTSEKDDGQSLPAYNGPDAGQIKVGGKLNKLVNNVALGRDMAGQRATYNEPLSGFTFTKFDGTTITV